MIVRRHTTADQVAPVAISDMDNLDRFRRVIRSEALKTGFLWGLSAGIISGLIIGGIMLMSQLCVK